MKNLLFILSLVLIAVPAAAQKTYLPADDLELFVNTGFENGSTGWGNQFTISWPARPGEYDAGTDRITCTLTPTSDAHSGAKALKVTNRNNRASGPIQDLKGKLVSGNKYTVSLWIKPSKPIGGIVPIIFYRTDQDKDEDIFKGRRYLFFSPSKKDIPANTWTHFTQTVNFTFSGNLVFAYLVIICDWPIYKGDYIIDDFSLIRPSEELTSPIVSPYQAAHTDSVKVTLRATRSDTGDIYYTLDGSKPTPSSLHYTKPFVITSSAQVKARTFRDRMAPSVSGARFYSVRPAALPAQSYKLEAETMTLSGDYEVDTGAMEGGGIKIKEGGKAGSAQTAFTGMAGVYDLVLETAPYNLGSSRLTLSVNGTRVMTDTLPTNINNTVRYTPRRPAGVPGIALAPGDVLKIDGTVLDTDQARVDRLVLYLVKDNGSPVTDRLVQTAGPGAAVPVLLNGPGLEKYIRSMPDGSLLYDLQGGRAEPGSAPAGAYFLRLRGTEAPYMIMKISD